MTNSMHQNFTAAFLSKYFNLLEVWHWYFSWYHYQHYQKMGFSSINSIWTEQIHELSLWSMHQRLMSFKSYFELVSSKHENQSLQTWAMEVNCCGFLCISTCYSLPGKFSHNTSIGVARFVSPIFWYLSFNVSA